MGKKILCMLLITAMILTSADFTVYAEEIRSQVAEEVVETEEDASENVTGEGEDSEDIATEDGGLKDTEVEEDTGSEDADSGDAGPEDMPSDDPAEGGNGDVPDAPVEGAGEGADDSMGTESELPEGEAGDGAEETLGKETYANGESLSGTCGENLTWRLEGNHLTISGTGDMYDYEDSSNVTTAPWGEKIREIGVSYVIRLDIEEGVTSIGKNAFTGCTFESVKLPDSLIQIGSEAFSWSGFRNMRIPNSVESIGARAFEFADTGWGKGLVLPENLSKIEDGAFENCHNLGGIVIQGRVTSIGNYAFSGCGWTGRSGSLVIPDSVKSIGRYAFSGCSNLSGSLVIPDSVESIGDHAFSGCSGFSGSLVIPGSVETISEGTFENCSGIENVIFSHKENADGTSKLNFIRENAFAGCTKLSGSLVIPPLESIGSGAFKNCPNIKHIYLHEFRLIYGSPAFWEPIADDAFDAPAASESNGTEEQYAESRLLDKVADVWFHCEKDSIPYRWASEKGYTVKDWDGEHIDIYPSDDITINGKGYAYVRFVLQNYKGEVQKNTDINYSFDGNNYEIATSDENGYVTIKSPLLENESGKEEKQELKTTDLVIYYDDANMTTSAGTSQYKYRVVMEVTVIPLSFSQTWELGMERSLSGTVSAGVGGNIGVAGLEAQLAEAKITGNIGGSLSVEHTLENGVRSLTIMQNYSNEVGANARGGLAAEANIVGQGLETDILGAGAGITAGAGGGIGLKLENYDPENPTQRADIGKFMLAAQAQASGDVMLGMLAGVLGYNVSNLEQASAVISAEAGADLGTVKFNDTALGTLASAGTGMVITYDCTQDKGDGSKEIAFGCGVEAHGGVLELAPIVDLGVNILSASKDGRLEISAEMNGDQLQGFAVKKEESKKLSADDEFLLKKRIIEAVEVSYGREAVEQIEYNIASVKDFASGSVHYIFGDAQESLLKELDIRPLKGSYAASVTEQQSVSADFSVGLKAGLGLEAGVGLEGIYSCEYETAGGTYEAGKRYITNTNEIEEEVNNNAYTIQKLFSEPLEAVLKSASAFIEDVSGSVQEGIKTLYANLTQGASEAGERFKDWVLHLKSLKDDTGSRSARLRSYEITAYKTVKNAGRTTDGTADVSEYKACTIGEPYYAYVTDSEGNEITDYSANPLTLTLKYTDEMLLAAGLGKEQTDNIAVYMYSDELCGYICIGGAGDALNQAVAVDITKPGQYILAADLDAPVVDEISISQGTNKPQIIVDFHEVSGFKEFSLKIDDEEIIGTADWNKYYNKAYQRISYQVEEELADGKHTISVYAVDSAGNAMTAPYEKEFYIGKIMYTVTFELYDGAESIEIKCEEGMPVTLPEIPVRAGYIFKGWYTQRDGQGAQLTAGSKVTADLAVYAHWAKVYMITFETHDGVEPIEVEYEEGMPVMLPEFPVREGYIFNGWYTQKDGQGTELTAESVVTADLTVYAYWIEKEQGDVLNEDIPSDGIIPEGIWAAGINNFIYTGKNITQDFRLYDGMKRLKEKTDYTVSYKNNKTVYAYTDEDFAAFEKKLQESGRRIKTGDFDPQKAPQVIIKMKGNYSGKRVIYFKIEPTDISQDGFEADCLTVTYTGKKQMPVPELVWNGKGLKYGTDFYIPEYDNAKKNSNAFKEPNTYAVTLSGMKNFTGMRPVTLTISKSVKQIAMNKVTVKGIHNMPWTGNQIKQSDYTVKYKGIELSVENGDYTVDWGVNTDVGIGTVAFTGTGTDTDGDGFSFIGTKKVSFKITGNSMSKVSVSEVDKNYTYTGTAICPAAVLTYKANRNDSPVTLVEGIHYAVTYQKNEDKGTAAILFTGLESGGYTGTKKQIFKIVPSEIGDTKDGENIIENIQVAFADTENIKDDVYVASYMKGGAKPQVIVRNGGEILEPDKDYKVSYTNNKVTALSTDTKAPTVTVTGKGNYKGSKSIKFAIAAKPLSTENGITVVAADKVESTKANGYRQNFKVYDADGYVLDKKDYDSENVTYTLIQTQNEDGTLHTENQVLDKDSCIPAGAVIRITVQGKGIYAGGEATGTYRIIHNGCNISKATIRISNQSYTGSPVLINEQGQFEPGKVFIKIGNEKRELILGEDIEVVPDSYGKNVDRGTAKVTFRGINNFGGSKTVSFQIGTRSIDEIWKGIRVKVAQFFR